MAWRDGQGRQKSKTFTGRRDAEAFEAKVRLAKRQGELASLDAGRQPFRAFSDEWWATHAETTLTPKTRELYKWLLDSQLRPRLGDVQLRALTAEQIQRTVAAMLAEGVPVETTRKALTLLRGMLERAAEWGRIQHNPARFVRKPGAGTDAASRGPLPYAGRAAPGRTCSRRALSGMRTLRVGSLAYAGLRPGEALALTWGDLGKQTIRVDKAVSLGAVKSTKNRQSRTVHLLPPLANDLAEWRLASGRPGDGPARLPDARRYGVVRAAISGTGGGGV